MYTKEQEAMIKERYLGKPDLDTVKELALEIDKPDRSVISKLSAMGCYKRKKYVSKSGKPPERKEDVISRLSGLFQIDPTLLESLEKSNKYTLVLMEKKLIELQEYIKELEDADSR